ncbi:hypothetical protein [Listeria kieliensis]|nr:hypothetical protein [Listeria kieliensis]
MATLKQLEKWNYGKNTDIPVFRRIADNGRILKKLDVGSISLRPVFL